MRRVIVVLALLGFLSMPGWATQILPMTATDLAQRADLIFVGTCLSRDVRSATPPHTEYTFKIENLVKGSADAGVNLNVRQWGGTPESQSRVPRLMGMPVYTPGQTYMLYLGAETPAGLRAPVGLGQGVFKVTKQPDGALLVENELGNRFLFPAAESKSTPSKSKAIGPNSATDHLRLNDLIQSVRKAGGAP